MRQLSVLWFIGFGAWLTGCAGSEANQIAAETQPGNGALPLGELPASFSGVVPCADCQGIEYRLNLFPGQAYYLSRTYLGEPDGGPYYYLGSWMVSSGGQVLELHGNREGPRFLRIVDTNSLRMLDTQGREIQSSFNYTITRIETFERLEPHLAMRGMYQYMADAGLFTECLTRQRWPVAQVEANASLERAYLNYRRQPGEEVLVELDGRVELRPGMEGDTLQPALVVERFIGIWPGETCGVRFATGRLENTYWKLTRLGNAPVAVYGNQREPSIVLHADDLRVAGWGGCNRIMGSYTTDGTRIRFDELATTLMNCPEGMEQGKAFFDALAVARTWTIQGQHLEMFDENRELVARFQAVHF